MFIGGNLIRQFDGFRRLCAHAASQFHLPLQTPEPDLLLANRVLAGLGGPPAPSRITGRFTGDGLPILLFFLLTQAQTCQVGLMGDQEPLLGRLKGLVHLFGQAVYPTLTGMDGLSYQAVVQELGQAGVQLWPVVSYAADGEPTAIHLTGSPSRLTLGASESPCTLAVLPDVHQPLPTMAAAGSLSPTALLIG